jgi:hypothetical protein
MVGIGFNVVGRAATEVQLDDERVTGRKYLKREKEPSN